MEIKKIIKYLITASDHIGVIAGGDDVPAGLIKINHNLPRFDTTEQKNISITFTTDEARALGDALKIMANHMEGKDGEE